MEPKKILLAGLLVVIPFLFYGCKTLNVFSIQDDIALGQQVSQQIAGDPQQFPILPEATNKEVYNYIRGLTNKILNSGEVKYRNEFAWEVKIIDDDNTLNAFAAPGGYIYVYTGLIKYLDSEDQLAGVMGHEIAHADKRHSTRQLTKLYGLSALLAIATGNSEPGALEQLALGLVSLKFSRNHETEADTYSVKYLCRTPYNAAGAAGFFEKLEGRSSPPVFLSTHPDPGNRVRNINEQKRDFRCTGSQTNRTEYARIKKLL